MGFRAVVIGLLAAFVVTLPQWLWKRLPEGVSVAVILIAFSTFLFREINRSFASLGWAEFLLHVHSPFSYRGPGQWFLQGLMSFLLTLFGGIAGPEGAAGEWGHAIQQKTRKRSVRWFDQLRRTDIGCVIASCISAAFGAPLAGIFVPMELRVGGHALAISVSALVAFAGTHLFRYGFGLEPLSLVPNLGQLGLHVLADWQVWFSIAIVALASGLLAVCLIYMVGLGRKGLLPLFKGRSGFLALLGGLVLLVVLTLLQDQYRPSIDLIQLALMGQMTVSQTLVWFMAQFVIVTVLVVCFSTVGIIWPLFALGGFFGLLMNQMGVGHTALAVFAGASGLLGAVMGFPIASALIAFELTDSWPVLIACGFAGWIAHQVRAKLKMPTSPEADMEYRGTILEKGRSLSILKSLSVRDAMVIDFESVYEHANISTVREALDRSAYPFLPVVNAKGTYVGMLTADAVDEVLRSQQTSQGGSRLSDLLEAKDLLYRLGLKLPTVDIDDALEVTTGLFEEHPLVPVLGSDARVMGLLFAYSVRISYDQEVARQSMGVRVVVPKGAGSESNAVK